MRARTQQQILKINSVQATFWRHEVWYEEVHSSKILTFYFSLSISEVIADLAFGPKNSGAHFFLAVFFDVTRNGLSESVTSRSL